MSQNTTSTNRAITQYVQALNNINSSIIQINNNTDKIQQLSSLIDQISGKLLNLQYDIEYQLLSGNSIAPNLVTSQNQVHLLIPRNLKLNTIAQNACNIYQQHKDQNQELVYIKVGKCANCKFSQQNQCIHTVKTCYRKICNIYQNQTLVQLSSQSPIFVLSNGTTYKKFKFYYEQTQYNNTKIMQLKYFNHIDNVQATQQDLAFIRQAHITQIHLKQLQKVKIPMLIRFDFDEKLNFLIQTNDVDLIVTKNHKIKNNQQLQIIIHNISEQTKRIVINPLCQQNNIWIKLIPIYNIQIKSISSL